MQQAFLEAGAVQCGFCTPGLLVATHDLLARDPDPDDSEIREALAGNLCRCTGYEKILDAVHLAAAPARAAGDAMSVLVIDGCAVVTMDADRTEHAVGHVVVDGAPDRGRRRGPGAARPRRTRRTSTAAAAWRRPGW